MSAATALRWTRRVLHRPASVPTWAVDLLFALGLCAAEFPIFQLVETTSPARVALLLPGFLVLAWRRKAPRLVLIAVLAHAAVVALVQPDANPTLSLACALYTVASCRPMRASLEALTLTALVYVPASLERERRDAGRSLTASTEFQLVLVMTVFLVAVWMVGRWVGTSRARIVTLQERRERAAAEAVAAERRRMARELHDVVSHAVSIMVLQAAGARRVLATEPARAEEALGRIENLGKQSMAELRRLLGVLRAGEFVEVGTDNDVARPGLGGVDDLLRSFRETGLDVRSEVVGHAQPLDGSVDLSAFRIVQESLTNAAKHAGRGASVQVRQVWTDDALLLEISDGGPGWIPTATSGESRSGGPPPGGLSTGNGLVGLRERVRAVGGRLDAGPIPDGQGFRVSVALPIRSTRRTNTAEKVETSS